MDSIIRASLMYIFLMFILRVSGTRTLSEMTTFDFVLLLVIGDASQQAITSNDYSIINGVIIIVTFMCMDIIMAFLKSKFPRFDRLVDGAPLILINNGKLAINAMKVAQVTKEDILEAARKCQGLERLDQIKYAILEKDGDITIIPI